jgi:hypothetical protein
MSHNAGGWTELPAYGTKTAISGWKLRYQEQDGYLNPGPPYISGYHFTQKNAICRAARLNGTYSVPWNPWSHEVFTNVPLDIYPTDDLIPAANWAELQTSALASINPDNAKFDAPLFLFELRELPAALRAIGISLGKRKPSGSRNPGDAYLAWQFGWGPLLSDIRSLINFASQTQAKIDRLKQGAEDKRIEGKLPGKRLTWKSGWNSKFYTTYRKSYELDERNWFTTRYTFDPNILPDVDGGGLPSALRALGFQGSASTIWNMIPWSWLIDYCFTIGNFLEATQGNIPFTASQMFVMSEGTLKVSIGRSDWYFASGYMDGKVTSSGAQFVHKRRRYFAMPQAYVTFSPFLSDGQIGNLLALSTSQTSAFVRNG